MVSFLNGLSALGAGVAQFAGAAGLEQQKADLAQQQTILADQLATTRETAGRTQAGDIAATAAGKQQEFEAGQGAQNRQTQLQVAQTGAGATTGAATIQANAGAELRAAQARAADAATQLSGTELKQANDVLDLHKQLADQYSSPTPDPAQINTITSKIVAYGTSAATQSAVMTSLDSLAKTASLSAASLDRELATETNNLSTMDIDDSVRQQKQRLVDDLTIQRDRERTRANVLTDQAAGLAAGRANLAPPPTGAGLQGTAGAAVSNTDNQAAATTGNTGFTPSPTVGPAGPRASAARGPQDTAGGNGRPTGVGGSPTVVPDPSVQLGTIPGASDLAPPKPATTPAASIQPAAASATLPGDLTGATNLDALKAARPDLNIDALKGRSPAAVGIVMQYVDGRAALPTGRSLNQQNLGWKALALQVDPSLDEATSKARMATRISFAAGKDAETDAAINTALGHMGNLYNQFTALNNYPTSLINVPRNYIGQKLGDPRQGTTDLTINAVAGEMEKVYSGSGGNLAEVTAWKNSFPRDGSPTQQREALQTAVDLLHSKLEAQANKYNIGMGRTIEPLNLLTPQAQAVFSGLSGKTPIPDGGFAAHDAPATGFQLGNPSPVNPPSTAPRATPAISPPTTAPRTTPLAPTNPADRQVGKPYRSPSGQLGIWRGTGWQAIQ